MKADDYKWWKNRFKALEQYFDAMRIDHILGFFRIWRMPVSATQGILGYFYPAVPITLEEFKADIFLLILTDTVSHLSMIRFSGNI
jgi:4-alpha-glucanotransferase